MDEHNKFQDQKLLEEIIKDALDEQQVKLTITWPVQYELTGNYEEVMTKSIEFLAIYGKTEIKFELV